MPIKIISKKDGFRRAGLAHVGVKTYPDGYFTSAELAALRAEPNLVVSEGDEAPIIDGEGSAGGQGKTFKRLQDALDYIAETGDTGPHTIDAGGDADPAPTVDAEGATAGDADPAPTVDAEGATAGDADPAPTVDAEGAEEKPAKKGKK